MQIHDYLVVLCKTPGCKEIKVLKHLGIHGQPRHVFHSSVPSDWRLPCGLCNTVHNYMLSDVVEQPGPPPPEDFQDKL